MMAKSREAALKRKKGDMFEEALAAEDGLASSTTSVGE